MRITGDRTMEPIINKTNSKHPEWNESYYFAFYSKEHRLGGSLESGSSQTNQKA